MSSQTTQVGNSSGIPAVSKAMPDLGAGVSTTLLHQGSRGFHKPIPLMKLQRISSKTCPPEKAILSGATEVRPLKCAAVFWWSGHLRFVHKSTDLSSSQQNQGNAVCS